MLFRESYQSPAPHQPQVPPRQRSAADATFAVAIRSWSLVHGFAMLLIDGQLPPDRLPDALLKAVLGSFSAWFKSGSHWRLG